MDRRKLPHSLLAFLLVALGTGVAAPPLRASPAVKGSVLFTHTNYDEASEPRSTILFRLNPANGTAAQLTPYVPDVLYNDPRWSPSGHRIVYERVNEHLSDRSQLYTLDLDSGQTRRITSGLSLHRLPVWGPHGQIALINTTTNCVMVVRASGRQLRTLFCPTFIPGATSPYWSEPYWSKDGRTLTIEARQYYQVGLSLFRQSQLYRVRVASGQVTQHLTYDLGNLLELESMIPMQLSPDGRKGLYSQLFGSGGMVLLINFRTGEQKYVGPGHGASWTAKWSHDGRRMAFTHHSIESDPRDPQAEHVAFVGLYVARADGSDAHAILKERESTPGKQAITFTVADWSCDDTHILLNRSDYSRTGFGGESVLGHPRLEVVNVATGAARILPKARGSAGDGSWFQH